MCNVVSSPEQDRVTVSLADLTCEHKDLISRAFEESWTEHEIPFDAMNVVWWSGRNIPAIDNITRIHRLRMDCYTRLINKLMGMRTNEVDDECWRREISRPFD